MKNSPKLYLVVLLLLAGSIAGVVWYRQTPAPKPHVVAVIRPKVEAPAPGRVAPPPVPPADAPDAPDPAAPTPAELRQQFGQAMATMLSNPQVQQGINAMAGAMANAMYSDVFASMNLSQEDLAAVNDLMAQRAQAANAVLLDVLQQGGDPGANRDQIVQQVQQAQAGVDQSLRSIIGDDNFQQVLARDQQLQQTFQGGRGGGG